MNSRDIGEIRRRLNPDHRNPSVIRGYYVNGKGEGIAEFIQPVISLPETENQKYMGIFRKILSGTMGQNLMEADIPLEFIPESQDYQLLARLRESALMDGDAVQLFYAKVAEYISAMPEEGGEDEPKYLILLTHEAWDVPGFGADGSEDQSQSESVFPYMIAAVCPVKPLKPGLRYQPEDRNFCMQDADWVVGAPAFGFLYPAWEDHGANITRALFYTRDLRNAHEDLIVSLFGASLMPAARQEESFRTILTETLGESLDLDVLCAVGDKVQQMIEENKADRTAEPVKLTKEGIRTILTDCGVPAEKAEAFETRYEEDLGAASEMAAVNIAPKKYAVKTPSVSITVAPENIGLIETRILDGRKYVLVQADGPIEVNGVEVHVAEEE